MKALLERNLIPELPISGTLGIPRSNMPQIAKDHQEEFFDYLKDEGIRIHNVKIAANDLKPTQNEINSDKVADWVLGKKPIVISSDHYLLDGHHQWAKAMLTDEDMKIDCIKVEMPIRKLLDYAKNFSKTTYKDFQEGVQMKRLQEAISNAKKNESVESEVKEIISNFTLVDVLDGIVRYLNDGSWEGYDGVTDSEVAALAKDIGTMIKKHKVVHLIG